MTTMRVLVVTPDFPPLGGGISVLMHKLMTNAGGLEARIVTLDSPGADAFDRAEGLHVHRVPFGRAGRKGAIARLNAATLREARRFRPAVVLCGHIVGSPAARAAKRLLGVPYVQYLHADEVRAKPGLTRQAVTGADAVIAVSRYTAGLATDAGADPGRVHVVWNGVDLPDREPASERAGEPTILSVASLDYRYKGHDVLVRAMPLIRSRIDGARLVLVGDGALRGSLEQLAGAHGLNGAVSFVGRVPDAERDAWLDRAHVFAMPSRLPAGGSGGEGFGIVYLEASARGLPVVAGNVAGAPDAVVDGKTGVLVDPTDHVAVADAIAGLLTDPSRAQALGRAGAIRAREFAWPRVAAALERVLGDVVAGVR